MATGGDDKVFKRPDSLLCDSQSAVTLKNSDDQMRHFVTENLEEKLRILTPQSKMEENLIPSQNTPSSTKTTCLTNHLLQMPHIPQIDANVLNDIEIEAQYLATSVDNLTENLCNLLHSISSITADNVEVHKNAVDKLTDSIDANIKCMYTIMAKAEEISKSMQPTERIGTRIREIKRLVDVLDGIV